jgi:hypothetical protein
MNCFKPPDKRFFEGLGLNQRSKMTGRESELKSLKDILQSCQKEGRIAVSITGIGGIGYVTQSPNECLGILKSFFSRCAS